MPNSWNKIVINKGLIIRSVFVVFYAVGVVGLLLPVSNALFLKLTPLALVLSFIVLAFYHDNKLGRKAFFSFVFIYLVSFVVEAVGVNTGLIFGNYTYGKGLGLKVYNTPLLIGVNWLFLVYTSAALIEKVNLSKTVKVIIASVGMLMYDVLLEQIAHKLDMWYWDNNIIPLQNYVAWFALALLFHSLFKSLKIRIENKIAGFVITCQFLFFLLLYFFLPA
jgi:putative membrane protein